MSQLVIFLIVIAYIFIGSLVSFGYYTYKVTSGKWKLQESVINPGKFLTADAQDFTIVVVTVAWPLLPILPLFPLLWKGICKVTDLIVKGFFGIYALEEWAIKEWVTPKTNSVLPKIEDPPEDIKPNEAPESTIKVENRWD